MSNGCNSTNDFGEQHIGLVECRTQNFNIRGNQSPYIAYSLNGFSKPTPLGRTIESSLHNKLFISPYTSAGHFKNIRKPQSHADFSFVRPEMIFSIIPAGKPMTLP
jgi:hypothetical protein